MSQYQSPKYDSPNAQGYENDFDIFIKNGTPKFSEEAFAQMMRQYLSDSHEDATTSFEEQGSTAQCAEVYRPYHSQEHPFGGHGSQYGGGGEAVNPTDTVNYAPTQVTNESQTITSATPKYQSKRAEKRAALEAQGIDFGIDFRKKDEVKKIDGVLHVRYRDEWKPAVYHYELRAEMIAKAPPELYAHCPARGLGETDVECGRLEAMSRENGNRISKRDFKARMPPTVLKQNGRVAPLISENAIGMRRLRFRDLAGLLAWDSREGSSERKKALVQCIPSKIMAQIILDNNTRIHRDLTKEEILFINRANRGLNPQKAGSKKLSDDERQQREAAKDVKLEGFQPVNEPAWPYLDDPDNNQAAIARARMSLGLLPAEPNPPLSSTHGVAIDNQESEEQKCNSASKSKAQSYGSRTEGKKRFWNEEMESSNLDIITRAKRRCDFTEFGVNVSNQNSSLSHDLDSEDLVVLRHDHELRTSAQYLSYVPRPVRNVTPRHESLPGEPKFAHRILQGELETRWVNPLLEGPLQGSQTLPHTIRPFEGQFTSATASNTDHGQYFERGAHPAQPLDYRLEVPTNEAEGATVRGYIGLAEADYSRYLGVDPPNLGSGDASYIDQWWKLQALFAGHWPLGSEPPRLWRCDEH
ncbi:MAG: hypothetical protein Q9225_003482 [Loekoesia sp. 1 TL-2023]